MAQVQVTQTELGKMSHPIDWWIANHRYLGLPTTRLLKAYKGDGIIAEIKGVQLIISNHEKD